ncbi:MAG: hypothetical protein ACE5F4_02330 [Candidatus Paceibacteria bacterium]
MSKEKEPSLETTTDSHQERRGRGEKIGDFDKNVHDPDKTPHGS